MTAGRIILPEADPSLDRDGNPLSKAKLYFYQKGTTTPQPVYTDSTLGVALSNPVVADGAGRMPQMWADIEAVFDVKWTDANDALLRTFANIASLTTAVAPDGSGIVADDFRDALGLGTAALEDTGTNGHALPFLDGDNDFSGHQEFSGRVTKDEHNLGYLGLPPSLQNNDYTFALSDVGKRIIHDDGNPYDWTIPLDADVNFILGDGFFLRNTGTGAITIKRTSGVILRIAGSGTDKDCTLASFGAAVLFNDSADHWCIMGAGVS